MTKKDLIFNALLVGMNLQDAYIYAGCTEREILEFSENAELQLEWQMISKKTEYGLLEKLQTVIDKQVNRGSESALTWFLQRLNPRYTDKPLPTLPDLHLHIDSTDPEEMDTVRIYNTSREEKENE